MEEPADLRRAVQLDAPFLETADPQHLVQQIEMVLGDRDVIAATFQRGQVTLGEPELAGLEQPAHDLAAPGLGQIVGERDLLRRDRGTEALSTEADELEPQLVRRLVSGPQRPRTP